MISFSSIAEVIRSARDGANSFEKQKSFRTQGKHEGSMRAALRFLGTWIIALGLIMLIIDGTKSLAAKRFTWTSLEQTWLQINPHSLDAAFSFFESRFFADLLHAVLTAVLSYPAFAVFGILGIVLALAGRRPRRERFLQPEYI